MTRAESERKRSKGRDMARIEQISISAGGVPKRAVPREQVGESGLSGDRQRDLEHHGGPERAVCLWSLEVIEALRAEGHPVVPGGCGENLTLAGLDWPRLLPGVRLRLGEAVLLEITKYCSPCSNIAASFSDGDFTRISQKRFPGMSRLYARVLAGGPLAAGDGVSVVAAGGD